MEPNPRGNTSSRGPQWPGRQVRHLDVSVAQITVATGYAKSRIDSNERWKFVLYNVYTSHFPVVERGGMKPNRVVHAGMGGEQITLDSKSIGRSQTNIFKMSPGRFSNLRLLCREAGEPRSWRIMSCPARCRVRSGLRFDNASWEAHEARLGCPHNWSSNVQWQNQMSSYLGRMEVITFQLRRHNRFVANERITRLHRRWGPVYFVFQWSVILRYRIVVFPTFQYYVRCMLEFRDSRNANQNTVYTVD